MYISYYVNIKILLYLLDRFWGSSNLLFDVYRCYSSAVKQLGVKLTSHLHLTPGLKLGGTLPLFPQHSFTVWTVNTLLSEY